VKKEQQVRRVGKTRAVVLHLNLQMFHDVSNRIRRNRAGFSAASAALRSRLIKSCSS